MTDSARRSPEFAYGVGTGIAIAAVLAQLWLAYELRHLADMYRDMQAQALPALTRLMITPVWRWGMPVAGAAAVTGLVVVRPRAAWAYGVAAAALVIFVASTWYFSQVPIFQMAGDISG